MGNKALIKQRAGNKSGADLKKVERLLASHKGLTATQLSWMAAGGAVDENGFCQPADLFSQCLDFFNLKRRISERAYEIDKLSEHPRALFQYGRAVMNPYDFGGQGIYPKGDMQSLSYERPDVGSAYVKPHDDVVSAPMKKVDAPAKNLIVPAARNRVQRPVKAKAYVLAGTPQKLDYGKPTGSDYQKSSPRPPPVDQQAKQDAAQARADMWAALD